ncbi:MAG: M64 family metallopeptidase, partial [Proteobacteria bacterium]|nr:M64 family metallopeptidase [Pseudomonadota bacterium]
MKILYKAILFTVFQFNFVQPVAACVEPACTKVINNGSDANKKVLVVLGDGYATADQSKYKEDVKKLITDGVMGNDFFEENQNAFNVYRLNLLSIDSGLSQKVYDENGTPNDGSDDSVVSTTMKNTALKYIYSGSWAHCWLEGSAQTAALVQAALSASVPNYDYTAIILNEDGFGGCGGGGRQIVTRNSSWAVMAHEFGHGVGGLRDEYTRTNQAYTGGVTNNRNCSTVTNRNNVFWNRFINPSTTIPTTLSVGMNSNKTVGIFEGCSTKDSGIYRPVHNCRMKGNTPEFGPVCYTLMKQALK